MDLGPFRELEEVGRGGMGVVYKAYDPSARLRVAIKTIHRIAASDQEARLALVREAGATAKLVHPNIVRVLDVGQQQGLLYIVMEYLEGEPLNRILRAGRALPFSFRLEIVRQICVALQYAHERGIVHRDIKPGNVYILEDQSVKVLDFGLASVARLQQPAEFKGVVGTPNYMSPEQFKLEGVGPASDIWSAGVTLFELLCCRLPFTGADLEMLRDQILHAEIPTAPPSWPFADQINRVFGRSLAKQVEDRYRTAGEFAEDLEKLIPVLKQSEDHICWATNQDPFELDNITSDKLVEFDSLAPGPLPDSSSKRKPSGGLTHPVDPVSDQANRERTPVGSYTPPELGFRLVPSLDVRMGKQKYNHSIMLKLTIPFVGAFGIGFYFLAVAALDTSEPTPFVAAILILVFSFGAVTTALFKAEKWLTEAPRCPGCKLPMSIRSEWWHYAKSRAEDSYMRRDCVNALRVGAWEEATKLFTILGRRNRRSDAWRYQLAFYECVGCAEHAARFAVHESVIRPGGQEWEQKSEAIIAYAGAGTARPRTLLPNLIGLLKLQLESIRPKAEEPKITRMFK